MGDMADELIDRATFFEDDLFLDYGWSPPPPPKWITCHYCGRHAKKVCGKVIYPGRKDLWDQEFYYCKRCLAWVGCYSDGRPLGSVANAELREWRGKAHRVFDRKWISGSMSRSECYRWLQMKMKMKKSECHIAKFDIEQCKKVIRICGIDPDFMEVM